MTSSDQLKYFLKKRFLLPIFRSIAIGGIGAFGILLSGCAPATNIAGIPNALDTRGPVSSVIATEWWIQFALGMVVYVVVVGILIIYSLCPREPRQTGCRCGCTLIYRI
jgi:hypothetical protein